AHVRLYDGVEVRLHVVAAPAWGAALLIHTGSESHVARLHGMAEARGLTLDVHGLRAENSRRLDSGSEEAVYAALGLPWIAPELREDTGEIEAALAGALPRLVSQGDLRGDLHCHTEWTDGTATLEDMALAARSRGYA